MRLRIRDTTLQITQEVSVWSVYFSSICISIKDLSPVWHLSSTKCTNVQRNERQWIMYRSNNIVQIVSTHYMVLTLKDRIIFSQQVAMYCRFLNFCKPLCMCIGYGWHSIHGHLTLKVLVVTIDAQWEGMGDVGSARYEPALLPPCPTIRVLSYSN